MLLIKAFHIISVITWFAGLFYLPRLYVYHAMASDEISIERFKVMERKLFFGIMTPSAVIAVVLGIMLLGYGFKGTWLNLKLILVALTLVYHGWCWLWLRRFAQDQVNKGHVYFRLMNEVPVLMLVGIVLLVVLKPFA